MNKFDIKSSKFVLIILIICFLFTLLIMRAYTYLPESNNKVTQNLIDIQAEDNQINSEEVNKSKENKQLNENEKSNFNEVIENSIDGEITEINNNSQNNKISESSNNNNNNELHKLLEKGLTNKTKENYGDAITNYQNALTMTNSERIKATCYEEIANIYGIQHRYGVALPYAEKAHNLFPTSSNKMLLARLYHKTGNITKSTKLINELLEADIKND